MNSQAQFFKIGLFVLITVAGLLGGVVVLGAGDLMKEEVIVETYFTESVEGLSIGSEVKHLGVSLGRVTDISFLGRQYPQVNEEDNQFRFRNIILVQIAIPSMTAESIGHESVQDLIDEFNENGLRCRLSKSGLTGPTYVDLVFMDPEDYPLLEITWEPDHPYLGSAPSTVREFLTRVEDIMDGLEKIDFNATIARVDLLLDTVTQRVDQVDVHRVQEQVLVLVDDVQKASQKLEGLLTDPSLHEFIHKLPEVSDQAVGVAADVRKLVNRPGLLKGLDDFPQAIQSVQKAADRVALLSENLDDLTSDQEQQIAMIVQNLRLMSEEMVALTQQLKANPAAVLLSSPPAPVDPAR